MSDRKSGFLQSVEEKLRANESFLRHGVLGPGHQIRDEIGYLHTFSNILEAAGKFFDLSKGRDQIGEMIANFSNSSYGDIADVKTVGAIDVSIIALSSSILPYVCIDRSMANPVDTVYYHQLIAANTAGGVTEGDSVMPNFGAPNNDVNLGPANKTLSVTGTSGTASGGTTFDFSNYLVPGTVTVSITQADDDVFIGRDFNSDGKIYFDGINIIATVNYKTGVVTFDTLANTDVASVTVLLDVGAGDSADTMLRLKPEYTHTTLETHPKHISLDQNLHQQAFMDKLMNLATKLAENGNYSNIHFKRVASAYIEDVNRDVLKTIVSLAVNDTTPSTLSLASYTVTGFAETKDDLVNRFIINMRSRFLAKNFVPATVILTGTRGAAELESNKSKWAAAPGYLTIQNGVAGTFDGIPVFRHSYLDSREPNATTATFYMVSKLPDNTSGTLIFGEFIPLTQTGTIGNFNNPMLSTTGFFSQVGHKTIHPFLITKGSITYA